MFEPKKGEIYYLEDKVKYCPNREDGKRCHEHSNPARNLIHNIHCFVSLCPYNRIYPFDAESGNKYKK